MGTEYRFLH